MHGLFKTIDWAAPNMKVMELALLPSTFGKNVMWRYTSEFIRHVVMQENRVLDGHGPQTRIGNIGPMNGRMKHHCPGNCHDGLYVAFGNSIVMMGSCNRKSNDLCQLGKLRREFFGSEGRSIISQERLCNDSQIA